MELFPFQREALRVTAKRNRAAYYMDMGLGKTFVGAEKLKRLNADTNLLICQKSKIRDWIEHFKAHYPEITVRDLTRKKELDDFMSRFTAWHGYHGAGAWVGVINYELVFRRSALKELCEFTLLLDESSLIQNETAKRTKFILNLTPENVILLSGTPTSGKYENLWSQIHLLGWNISSKLYNRHYVNWITEIIDGFPIRMVDKETPYRNVDRLKDKLREHGAFFLKTEECFDLPDQVFIPVTVPTIPEYHRFRANKLVEIDGLELVGDSTLAARLYSRMLCGHFNAHKLNAFADLLQSTKNRLIVFYNFNAELNCLMDIAMRLEKPISQMNGAVKDLTAYDECEDSVTFVQYQAGAMGLNLQKANTVIYFTLTDKSELFEQSKKRVHRIGQGRTCFYYLLMCKTSVEEAILQTLEQRRDFTDELFKECEV